MKYMGDGGLALWRASAPEDFDEIFCTALVAAMRQFQKRFAEVAPEWEKKLKVQKLPKRVRVGIASGMVYPLREPTPVLLPGDTVDYVGYCMNLAVRLQNHCPEVGFLVHGTLHPAVAGLVPLEALGMKGTKEEPVFAFQSDLDGLQDEDLQVKFRRIKPPSPPPPYTKQPPGIRRLPGTRE